MGTRSFQFCSSEGTRSRFGFHWARSNAELYSYNFFEGKSLSVRVRINLKIHLGNRKEFIIYDNYYSKILFRYLALFCIKEYNLVFSL